MTCEKKEVVEIAAFVNGYSMNSLSSIELMSNAQVTTDNVQRDLLVVLTCILQLRLVTELGHVRMCRAPTYSFLL